MQTRKPKWGGLAIAIEFWIATALVSGVFVAGAWRD